MLKAGSSFFLGPGLIRYLGIGKQQALGLYECLNGDEPGEQQQKLDSLPQFEAAVKAYFRQDFPEAVRIFEALLQRYPNDGAARFFAEEARRLAREGAPEGWTGVVEMRVK